MPGTSLVHNLTGKPEPVFTDSQWSAIQRNGTGGGDAHVAARVFVGDREITDIARIEAQKVSAEQAAQLNNGRRI